MSSSQTRRCFLWPPLLVGFVLSGVAHTQTTNPPPTDGDRAEPVQSRMSQARELLMSGQTDAALQQLDAARAINPDDADVHVLTGDVYAAQGEYRRAAASYERAMQLHPDSPGGLCNYAWLLATCPADAVRDGKRATQLCDRLLGLVEGKDALKRLLPVVLDTCAAAYAESGQFEAAVRFQQRAIDALPDGDAANAKLAEATRKEFSDRLALYRDRRPYRDRQKKD